MLQSAVWIQSGVCLETSDTLQLRSRSDDDDDDDDDDDEAYIEINESHFTLVSKNYNRNFLMSSVGKVIGYRLQVTLFKISSVTISIIKVM